jgi:hypothetical protein
MKATRETLSSRVWDVLALAGVAATVLQGELLLLSHGTPFARAAFALTGIVSVACIRRSRLMAKQWDWVRSRGVWIAAWSFCLVFLAAMLFPVFAKARARNHVTSDASKLKMIALAFQQYAQDYDGLLPSQGRQRSLRNLVSPYLNSEEEWKTNGGDYFIVNTAVMGSSVRSFPDSGSSVVLAYSPTLRKRSDDVPYRLVTFLDYRVDAIPETRFDWLLLESRLNAVHLAKDTAKTPKRP